MSAILKEKKSTRKKTSQKKPVQYSKDHFEAVTKSPEPLVYQTTPTKGSNPSSIIAGIAVFLAVSFAAFEGIRGAKEGKVQYLLQDQEVVFGPTGFVGVSSETGKIKLSPSDDNTEHPEEEAGFSLVSEVGSIKGIEVLPVNYLSFNEIQKSFLKIKEMTVSQRIVFWSNLLDQKGDLIQDLKKFSATQKSSDPVPVIPEKFNSFNFVELALALAQSKNLSQLSQVLTMLRYRDGETKFETRNIMMEAEWIPNVAKLGWAQDLTPALFEKMFSGVLPYIQKEMNKREYLASHHSLDVTRIPAAVSGELASQSLSLKLPYLTLPQVETVLNSALKDQALKTSVHGSILSLMHEASSSHSEVITHQGVVFFDETSHQWMLRHALQRGAVVTAALIPYLHRMFSEKNRSWPLIGVGLLQVRD